MGGGAAGGCAPSVVFCFTERSEPLSAFLLLFFSVGH